MNGPFRLRTVSEGFIEQPRSVLRDGLEGDAKVLVVQRLYVAGNGREFDTSVVENSFCKEVIFSALIFCFIFIDSESINGLSINDVKPLGKVSKGLYDKLF